MKPSAVSMCRLRASHRAAGKNWAGKPATKPWRKTPPHIRALWSTDRALYYKMYNATRP